MNVNARNFINEVNEENLHEKVGELLSTITRNHVSSTQTDIMFELWYMVSGIRDTGKSCGKCRGNIHTKLKRWYNDKNNKSK